MLEEKLKKGLKMTGEYFGDDDSGLDIDTDTLEMEGPIDSEQMSLNLKVSFTSKNVSVQSISKKNLIFFFGKKAARVIGAINIINNANATFISITMCNRWKSVYTRYGNG